MNILYSCDNNYIEVMGVSLVSLFENNLSVPDITVYFIDGGIDDANKERLQRLCRQYNRDLRIIEMIDIQKFLNLNIDVKCWALAAYSRLFLSEMLDDSVEKILYIDCDTIINESIEALWDLDLKDNLCAGVQDCISLFKSAIGFASNEKYYNSGVLLINLKQWRIEGTEKKFANYIKERNGNIEFADQSVANAIMKDRYLEIAPEYNMMSPLFCYPYESMAAMNDYSQYYTKEQIETAVRHPVIVHFTNGIYVGRPWMEKCSHPFTKQYLHYKAISPWAANTLWHDKRSKFAIMKEQILQRKNKIVFLVKVIQRIKGAR